MDTLSQIITFFSYKWLFEEEGLERQDSDNMGWIIISFSNEKEREKKVYCRKFGKCDLLRCLGVVRISKSDVAILTNSILNFFFLFDEFLDAMLLNFLFPVENGNVILRADSRVKLIMLQQVSVAYWLKFLMQQMMSPCRSKKFPICSYS